jgi:hypothetical protein
MIVAQQKTLKQYELIRYIYCAVQKIGLTGEGRMAIFWRVDINNPTRRQKMSANHENGNKMFETLEPATRATKAWMAEVEKLQQTTIESWSKAVDEGYKLAKESINNVAAASTNLQKQWQAQMERAAQMMTSIVP